MQSSKTARLLAVGILGVLFTMLRLGMTTAGAATVHGASHGPTCDGQTATIVGSSSGDTLHGTSGDDVIVAKGGNDIVKGRGGDDVICGKGGSDTLKGNHGADTLLGGGGSDD